MGVQSDTTPTCIDRPALVARHRIRITEIDPRSPLSVGNGEFAFTADLTGLQTFPELYPHGARADLAPGTLLGTQSQWGWHSSPAHGDFSLDKSIVQYATARGLVGYVDMAGSIDGGTERGVSNNDLWLRANPHRLDLGRIGFISLADGQAVPLQPGEVSNPRQDLDLWRGLLTSDFAFRGTSVRVETACHPELDLLAIRVGSTALTQHALGIALSFPYGSEDWHNAADWSQPEAHQTTLIDTANGWILRRQLDETSCQVEISGAGLRLRQLDHHRFALSSGQDQLEVSIRFSAGAATAVQAPAVNETLQRTADHWAQFWQSGGAVQLVESSDPRAQEIERRTVLSQYLTAINCAGSLPPQETGLVCNSWRGRFHLEMHWWHGAHFPLWGRPELLLPSLRWYHQAMPAARATAQRQGFAGVRWPKQVGPDARESPSAIGTFLIWQQPHPIYLAELIFRANPNRDLLHEFADIVFASADFMASYAAPTEHGFELLFPLVPAQESYGSIRARVENPAYELVYWHWALGVAQQWRARLGLSLEPTWQAVADRIIAPLVRDGVYPAISVDPYTIRNDHPSMLAALGVLPKTNRIDESIMGATLDDVLSDWDWSSTWGWDYPMIAMTAARLGRPETAVDSLLMKTEKNEYLANGHNWQTPSLPLYLPGNGGLLTAVALMAAGWERGPQSSAPGFPANSSWTVQSEGLILAP